MSTIPTAATAHNAAAVVLAALLVLSLVALGLLWGGADVAAASGLGRLPMLPRRWRRWLHGERDTGWHEAPSALKKDR